MKKHISLILAAFLCLSLLAGCGSTSVPSPTAAPDTGSSPYLTGVFTAEILIKDHGTIVIEMDADKAPITVTNFVNLARSGFYNGLTFHRIINGFMMQGGDPNGNGTGGSGTKIKGEFSANGIDNPQSHVRGAVSMARSKDMNSASSQFFIVHQNSPHLNGQYACFGYVISGMDVVDDICTTAIVMNRDGAVSPENQPVIESITVSAKG